MSDDLDDDLSMDESFDDFEKSDNTLGSAMRDNPLYKIGAVVLVGVLIFVVLSLFGGGDEPADQSYVGPAADVKSTPGSEESTPAYVDAIKELNEAEIERALNEGDSSIPVPIDPPTGVVALPANDDDAEDPLQRWRRLQEERLERELRESETGVDPNSAADVERAEAIAALAGAMSEQMAAILESRSEISLSTIELTDPEFFKKQEEEAQEDAEAELTATEAALIAAESAGEVLVPAAQIAYAKLLTEANTDTPGPVLAEIASGPLRGSRILGTFEEQNEYLTLTFDTVVYEGESIGIDAVALNPDTTLPGLVTEVDHRYFKRIVLPAAAAFVEGAASAIAESGLTTVTVEGDVVAEETDETDSEQEIASGIEEAGQELGEIIDEIADNTQVLVRVAAGTPIGVLFLEPVTQGGPTEDDI